MLQPRLQPTAEHLELPEGVTYRAGDYLVVLPVNPDRQVERVLKRFNLAGDDQVILQMDTDTTTLPTDQPMGA